MNEDLDMIREKEINFEKNFQQDLSLNRPIFLPATSSFNQFNRSAMRSYAKKYYNNYNPNYANFNGMGGDCTNFASQIIRSGGGSFDTTGNYTWYYYNINI